jgi:glycosyltransferase involved in cell wall biosynthesis
MNNSIKVSIIIPIYNEQEGIQSLIEKINDYYPARKFDFDIILVNDGSMDLSAEEILKYKPFPFPCKLINLSKNFGSHAAVRAGFSAADGDFTTCIPADLQISFDAVEALYSSALEGNEIVYGVREVKDSGSISKIFSHLYARLMQKYVNKNFPFKGFETLMISSKVKKHFNRHMEANSSIFLQALSFGFKSAYVEIEKVERKTGKSKWTNSKKIKLLIDSFVAFSYFPIRFVSLSGIYFFIIGILWTTYIIFRKFLYNDITSGWPALTSILFLGFGITNIALGIIAEYLWRTLDSSRNRPIFIIDEVIEMNDK